ncbi:MAG: MarR family transcriptional regulator [Fusobacteria bacterium]|nr:MAG: MarR family transcriptional regulator [Fusobacteriota bacterium]KAF0229011.1 MAG: MarR family transcriptional [Fusobacteriota bacterium]
MNDNKEIAIKLMDTLRRFKKIGFHTKCNYDLTPGQIGMLHLIYHQGNNEIKGISVRQISEMSQQTPSGVTQAINFLESKELVTRTIDEEDRRIMRVKLTPLGLKQVKEHHQNLLNLSYDFIENLGQERISTFIDILEEMIAYGERINKKDD